MRKEIPAVRRLEQVFLVSGIALLGIYGAAVLAAKISSDAAVEDFEAAASTKAAEPRASNAVDFSHWDRGRVQGYRKSLAASKKSAIAILRIQRLRIEVPVFEGTDSVTLNRGVGHIQGTSAPGGSGNSGIAGHRDGFFRGLKDISVGDEIELRTADVSQLYSVRDIKIVRPSETSVLADRGEPTLTLVTCFPFYLVGNANERFIVRATPTEIHGSADGRRAEPKQLTSNVRTQGDK